MIIYIKKTFGFLLFCILSLLFKSKERGSGLLIINNGMLGDMVISSVILKNDRLLTSNSECYIVINSLYKDLYKSYKGPIKIIFWNIATYRVNILKRFKFIRSIRNLDISTAINVSFSRRLIDEELTLTSGAVHRIAFQNIKSEYNLFSSRLNKNYSLVIPRSTYNDFDDLCLFLHEFTGKPIVKGLMICPDNKLVLQQCKDYFNSKRIIVVSPFSSAEIKDWSIKKYAELVSRISNQFADSVIFITGEPGKKKYSAEFNYNENIKNIIGELSLALIISLISNAKLFIGNDSGLFHIAKALDIPRVGIIGGGSYNLIHPYGSVAMERLLFAPCECFGCNWNCTQYRNDCLDQVSVEDVLTAVLELL